MSAKLRAVAALGLVLGLLAILALGRYDTEPSTAAPVSPARFTSADCRRCHGPVWDEWQASYHSRSWSDDAVQAAFQHFGNDRKCHACHAPEPVLVTGLDQPVALRSAGRESGVDCLSCHALPGGVGVAAVRTLAAAPCRPQATSVLSESRVCGTCHTAIYRDWEASRFAGTDKKTCQDCHMPAVQGRQAGRSHECLGSHNDALVRSGATMNCRQEGNELVVEVTNHATGHNFPGERHNRMLLVQVIERDASGQITLARQELIKGITPFRGESSAEQIRAGETFVGRFPVVDPAVVAEVELIYKRFPWLPDRESLVVHRQEVKLTP